MPTRLLLIRHGESRSNAEAWLSGVSTCGGLSELGRVGQQLAQEDGVHRLEQVQIKPRFRGTPAGLGVAVPGDRHQ